MNVRTSALGLVLLLLVACSSPPPGDVVYPPAPASSPDKVVWYNLPGGLSVTIEASPDVNFANGQAHAVNICVMQTQVKDPLVNLASSSQGIVDLLQCKTKAPDIISADAYSLQPGEEKFVTADRKEGARFVAVVAGYDELAPEKSFAIVPFPLAQDSQRSGFLFTSKEYTYAAAPMDLYIQLGNTAMEAKGETRGE